MFSFIFLIQFGAFIVKILQTSINHHSLRTCSFFHLKCGVSKPLFMLPFWQVLQDYFISPVTTAVKLFQLKKKFPMLWLKRKSFNLPVTF